MTENIQPIIRNLLRYLAGLLLASGMLPETAHDALIDPTVLGPIAGAILGVVSELWYRYAKKSGGAT